MDGAHDNVYINTRLTSNLSLLFNPEFYRNLTGTGEMELKKALFINSLSDWKPLTPLHLYHGTKDEVIPYNNSRTTYLTFLENKTQYTEFISIPEGTHASSIQPMIDSVLPWFDTFSQV